MQQLETVKQIVVAADLVARTAQPIADSRTPPAGVIEYVISGETYQRLVDSLAALQAVGRS